MEEIFKPPSRTNEEILGRAPLALKLSCPVEVTSTTPEKES
jgi:hypothetical protein